MMEKQSKQQSIVIRPVNFQNDDPIIDQINNIGKCLVALQPKSSLHSIVYPVSNPK